MGTPKNDNAGVQAGGVGKSSASQFAFSFGEVRVVKPREPDGQAGQVLRLIREHQPLLSLILAADYAIPETAARIHDLRAIGWNVITTILPRVTFRGAERSNVATYSLGSPEWVPPCGRAS